MEKKKKGKQKKKFVVLQKRNHHSSDVRACPALPTDPSQIPAPIPGSSQPPITPASGKPDTCITCMYSPTHIDN